MFARWLTKFESVHKATTQEEREAIYRFRYTVYVEELNRSIGGVDHERRWVHDADDHAPSSTLLYTGTPQEVTGTLRLCHWEPGQVPPYDFKLLSMHVFPDIQERHVAEVGRFMIRPNLRGKLILPAFAHAAYEVLVGERHSELLFCYCSPGLVPLYRKLGMRPYSGAMVPTADGMHVPLVAIPSDHEYFRQQGSPVAPLIKRYYGPGKRPPVELSRYAAVLSAGALPIEVEPARVWEEVQEEFLAAGQSSSFLEGLSDRAIKQLTSKGFIVDVPEGTLVTQEGFGEKEMFVILDGIFEALVQDRRLAVMGKGEVIGEVAFFRESGRRSASVRATTAGRVLALRRRFLEELMKDDPALAAQLLFNLARIMSERLARQSSVQQVEPPAEVFLEAQE
jgi:hypothetical protein